MFVQKSIDVNQTYRYMLSPWRLQIQSAPFGNKVESSVFRSTLRRSDRRLSRRITEEPNHKLDPATRPGWIQVRPWTGFRPVLDWFRSTSDNWWFCICLIQTSVWINEQLVSMEADSRVQQGALQDEVKHLVQLSKSAAELKFVSCVSLSLNVLVLIGVLVIQPVNMTSWFQKPGSVLLLVQDPAACQHLLQVSEGTVFTLSFCRFVRLNLRVLKSFEFLRVHRI